MQAKHKENVSRLALQNFMTIWGEGLTILAEDFKKTHTTESGLKKEGDTFLEQR